MRRTISIILAICMMAALLAGCGTPAPAASETRAAEPEQPVELAEEPVVEEKEDSYAEESSAFTANIDKYWQEHGIDDILATRNSSKEDLADTRAQMLAMYGENKEITGEYDEALAANTVSGTYVGQIVSDEVVSWKGIPYAKQPVGELRWRVPQAPEASDKVYEAYYFGSSSVQVEGGDEPASLYPQGEDCLNLNLWNNRADETGNKPIMVWIHGGAYIQGGACTDEYDGTNFVKKHPDVIFASIDYRTDFVGFINLSKVPGAEDYKDSANLGLLDEIQALAWLKENAAAFGGDPERITIFGESAGGGSVSSLTLAPQAKGLFKRAIMQSGVSSGFLRTAEKSIEHTDKIMNISGAKNIDDLLSLTKTDMRKIATIIGSEDATDYTYPQPDGIVVPLNIKEALNSNQRDGFDIMIGTTKDEYNYWTMLLGKEGNLASMQKSKDKLLAKMDDDQKARFETFLSLQGDDEYNQLLQYTNYLAFHCPSRYEAKTHAANGQNTYVYYFTEESNDPVRLADHGYDLGFVLGNVEEDRAKDIPAAWKLSEIMQQMWVNFAKTGDPSLNDGEVEGAGDIKWDKFVSDDYPVMIFNSAETKQENDPIRESSDLIEDLFWLRLKNTNAGNEPTVTKVADMLYEVTFDEYSAEAPEGVVTAEMSGEMGCSGVRNGNFVGRNFDYIMNQSPTFVIRTTAKEGRYATIGVGRLANINSEAVEAGLPKEKLDLLPWFMLDGMNEKGLVVNDNVLYKSDWGEVPHTGTNPSAPELNDNFLIRALLDNCADADEAVEYLLNYNITPMVSEMMDLHFMISDPEKTYVVEFINNEIVVKEQYVITNYFINMDKIPEHPDGLERMKILQDNYDEGSTMEGMYQLMQRAKYSNMYYASNKWYSELGFTYSQIQEMSENNFDLERMLTQMQEEFEEEMEDVKANGYKEKTSWWTTSHTSVYDINSKKMWVTVRERYEEEPHEFAF